MYPAKRTCEYPFVWVKGVLNGYSSTNALLLVQANLWDVTDKDIDRFSSKMVDGAFQEVSHFTPQNRVGRGRGIRNGAVGAVRLPKILVLL